MNLPERDWKHLSRLKPLALDRLCRRILEATQTLVEPVAEGRAYRAYIALCSHIQDQDEVVAACFGDWRRSRARIRIIEWRRHQLLTDEEYAGFSGETRAAVEAWFTIMGEST